MNETLSQVYSWASRFSRLAAGFAILVSVIFHIFSIVPTMSLQLAIAVIALTLGIPHGAIDHLITLPKEPRSRVVTFIFLYIAIAVAAGFGIANANRIGFQAVVLMSSLHFGFGDAAYSNEWKDFQDKKRDSLFIILLYALPAGLLPVVLPLTDSRAASTLKRINPSIANWAGTYATTFRLITITLAIICYLVLLLTKRVQLAVDLALLAALSLIATPLITFAIYFGCWHAVRHTARLVPKLPNLKPLMRESSARKKILAAFMPGLYAVVGTYALASALLLFESNRFSYGLLWTTLVIVWSLTVPHMIITAKFDLPTFKYMDLSIQS